MKQEHKIWLWSCNKHIWHNGTTSHRNTICGMGATLATPLSYCVPLLKHWLQLPLCQESGILYLNSQFLEKKHQVHKLTKPTDCIVHKLQQKTMILIQGNTNLRSHPTPNSGQKGENCLKNTGNEKYFTTSSSTTAVSILEFCPLLIVNDCKLVCTYHI